MTQIEKGYSEGEKIAKLSVLTLLAIGIFEIATGFVTRSIGVTADGVDSLSDSIISLIVWFGLRLSRRSPDRYFHYGYFKVESYSALLASIGMIGVASLILYRAYQSFLAPNQLSYPALALFALAIAGTISLYRALQMRRIAKRYNLLSLQVDASNSIKDGTASFLVFGSVLLASIGFTWMDAVGAIVISFYIYSVAYVAIKESSLVLLDSFNSPEVLEMVRETVKKVPEVREVIEVKLRRAGPFITGRLTIAVNPDMKVAELDIVTRKVEIALGEKIGSLRDFAVIASSSLAHSSIERG